MPLLNKSLKPAKRAGREVGDKMYGAPGGFRDSAAFVCSYKVSDAIAAETGLSAEHAHRFLIAAGKVFQRMLLAGEPVGIPHLGVLLVTEQVRRVAMQGLVRKAKAEGFTRQLSDMEGRIVRVRLPRLIMPDRMRCLFNDNAMYTGELKEHVAKARDHLKRRLRRHNWDRKSGLKHTQEGPIMEPTNTPPAKPARRMLVEDADAIVERDDKGREKVTKVADRPAEADRRGVSESEL